MIITIGKTKYTNAEKMYLFIWTLYCFSYFVFNSELAIDYNVGFINRGITYLTIIMLLAALIIVKQYNLKQLVRYFTILIITFLVELNISDRTLMVDILFIMLAQHISIDKLLKYDIKLKSFILVVIVSMCAFGITENYAAYMNGNYKQAWGFQHPNIFTCYVLIILVEWLCVRYSKIKWYEWLIVACIALFVSQVGGGRSSAYTFFGIYLIFLLSKSKALTKLFLTKIVRVILCAITPLLAIISFVAVSLYNKGNAFFIMLDTVMTGRISTAARFLKAYDLRLFGQKIEYIGTRAAKMSGVSTNILDNAYIHCALSWGVAVLVVIIISYSFLFRKLLMLKRIDLCLLCLFFVLLGIGETYMLEPIYNLSMLCILGLNESSVQTDEVKVNRKSTFRLLNRLKA